MGAMKDISLAIDEALGLCDGPRWHIAYWCCPRHKYSEHWQAIDQITGRRYSLPVCTTRATDDTLVEWLCQITGEHIENDCYSVYVDRNSDCYARSQQYELAEEMHESKGEDMSSNRQVIEVIADIREGMRVARERVMGNLAEYDQWSRLALLPADRDYLGSRLHTVGEHDFDRRVGEVEKWITVAVRRSN